MITKRLDFMEKIGEKLRAYFEKKGIKQEELATLLGVSQPYVNALLNDKKSFGKKQAQKWNELFGLSVNWLLTGLGDMYSDSVIQNNQNGDNIHGHSVTVNKTEKYYLSIIKMQAEQLSKSQEQIDRLLSIIEKMQ